MAESMVRTKSAEEVRRLKAKGIFDVGTHYLPHGLNKIPKHKYWDRGEHDQE